MDYREKRKFIRLDTTTTSTIAPWKEVDRTYKAREDKNV